MGYREWFETHGKKHAAIIQKLTHLSDDEVIAYFRYENMVAKEPDFCPLYADNKKCHEMEDLNCYLCACPNFRFNDEGFETAEERSIKSYCAIDSKEGDRFETEDAIHQDCSGCTIPHHEAYIRKHFHKEWFAIMRSVSDPLPSQTT